MPKLDFPYELHRSSRRTLGVKISADAKVEVHAPRRMSISEIEAFLFEKREWISDNLKKMQERRSRAESFVPGERSGLLLLGREYELKVADISRPYFDGTAFCLPETMPEAEAAAAIKEVYRSIAKAYLVKRTLELAEHFGESVNSVKINSARSRWGSCTSQGNINLSLFLVMAPSEAVDYCIIHELSHLKHMDHSAAFWSLVSERCPNYESCRAKLKELNLRLLNEKW